MKKIKISIPMMLQTFHVCNEDYIKNNCKGRCCQGSGKIMITIHDTEKYKFKDYVSGNFLIPDNRGLCPFKNDNGLCDIHLDKPIGCKMSPFTLNKNDTLIIRNRYRLLKCYKEGKIPAYLTHMWSLKNIVGDDGYNIIKNKIENNEKEIFINIEDNIYNILKDNDNYKRYFK